MTSGGIRSVPMARRWSSADTGTSTGQPASPCQPGRRTVEGSVPCASINDVIVSGPTHVIADLAHAVRTRTVEVGDPGVQYDADTPYADLPPYEGPPQPPAGHTHEWGDDIAGRGVDEDVPGEGRGLAPFPQAADDTAVDLG